MSTIIPTTIIALSGQTGSGKTSLANELSKRHHANFVSFGSFVRAEALQRGLEIDKFTLQNLGQALIEELGADEFIYRVLLHGQADNDNVTVLDGVRSVEIWTAIQRLTVNTFLIYIDVEEEKRISRIKSRDKLTSSFIELAMNHPMEKGISSLRQHANLILEEAPIDDMVLRVVDALVFKEFYSKTQQNVIVRRIESAQS